MKIMLVDDSKTMRNIQKRILESLGHVTFIEAADGTEAMTQLSSGPYQLIVIDWNMPQMDGITLVAKIRAVDPTTPLIMVTTEAEKDRVLEALKAGVNNYVIKPFTPESLLKRVKQTLAKAA